MEAAVPPKPPCRRIAPDLVRLLPIHKLEKQSDDLVLTPEPCGIKNVLFAVVSLLQLRVESPANQLRLLFPVGNRLADP